MQHIRNGNLVHTWINDRQRLEVELAWELLEIFNTNIALITALRNIANQALQEIRQLKASSFQASAAVTQAWQSQKDICQLCKKHPRGFNSIVVATMDAQDCSDLIRMYGEFIEKAGVLGAQGAAGPRGDYQLQDAIKSSYRVGNERWNKNPSAGAGRQRETAEGGRQSTSDTHSFIISQKGGAARWQLTDASTVRRVDNVYGLAPLADISGTTTDTIFFMERFAGPVVDDSIFYMLPLATLVANGHHSVLEVALSLTINSILDYRIGYYQTLFPTSGAVLGSAAIRNALNTADRNHRNRHFLTYFATPGVPEGCFLYENMDRWGFENFSKCDEVLDSFPWMPAWPNEDQLREYCTRRRLRTP